MRVAVGKPLLVHDAKVSYVARLASRDQATKQRMSHDWTVAGNWDRTYRELFHEPSPMGGENVAMNMLHFETPEQCAAAFAQQWRNSPGHYGNIIDGGFRSIGIGLARDARGRLYATQDFGR
jgi:uncharacterized protein YkwD